MLWSLHPFTTVITMPVTYVSPQAFGLVCLKAQCHDEGFNRRNRYCLDRRAHGRWSGTMKVKNNSNEMTCSLASDQMKTSYRISPSTKCDQNLIVILLILANGIMSLSIPFINIKLDTLKMWLSLCRTIQNTHSHLKLLRSLKRQLNTGY